MGRTRLARASISELKRRIEIAGQRKKYLEEYLHNLWNSYQKGILSRDFYVETAHKHFDGKTLKEWIDYYEHYIKECERHLRKYQTKLVRGHLSVFFLSALVIFIIFIASIYIRPELTGFLVQEIPEVVTEANATITTTQHQATLGQPVKWTKTISLDKPTTAKIRLSIEATNIFVNKISYSEENLEGGLSKEDSSPSQEEPLLPSETKEEIKFSITGAMISETEGESIILRFLRNIFRLTGRTIDTRTELQEIEINDTTTDYEVEYETPAPYAIEEDLERGKRIKIVGPETLHYENILSFTDLPENLNIKNPSSVRIRWVEQNTYLPIQKIEDQDNNGIYDYIEWVVPSLSEQTFEIIIEISKAEHLDENRNFISDIYEQVKELDDIWSETINNNESVRVTFAIPLTSDRDITIYPRIVGGTPRIEVYEDDGNELIAEFTSLNSNEYNKVLLTNLQGSQDTFDLKILDGDVEFDHIVDPIIPIFSDNFESGLGKWDGNGGTSWTTDGTRYISASNSLYSTDGVEGDIFSDDIDMSDALFINATFWFYALSAVDATDYDFYFCHGATCNLQGTFGDTSNDAWVWLTYTTSDSQYFTSDFYIRMNANVLKAVETSWIDDFLVQKTTDNTAPTVTLPVYTNATKYKNTQSLIFNLFVIDTESGASYCAVNVAGNTNQTVAVSSGWCNGTYALTGISDGNQTINAYANDTVGNTALNNSYVVWVDTTAPTWSSNSTNSTAAGTAVSHNIYWTDNVGLSGYAITFDNCTGDFISNHPMTYNSDFESVSYYGDSFSDRAGNRAYPWGFENWGGDTAYFYNVSAEKYSGSYSANITGDTTDDAAVLAIPEYELKPNITVGQRYRMEAWIKLVNVGGLGVRLMQQWFNSTTILFPESTTYGNWYKGNSGWIKISLTDKTTDPDNIKGDPVIELWGTGTVFIDNIKFYNASDDETKEFMPIDSTSSAGSNYTSDMQYWDSNSAYVGANSWINATSWDNAVPEDVFITDLTGYCGIESGAGGILTFWTDVTGDIPFCKYSIAGMSNQNVTCDLFAAGIDTVDEINNLKMACKFDEDGNANLDWIHIIANYSYEGSSMDTWSPFSGSPSSAWSNITKVINSTEGCTIKWKVWANDSAGNFNETDLFEYDTTSSNTPPTIPFVQAISPVDPAIGSTNSTTFNYTATDTDGFANLDNSTAAAYFQKAGETTRSNTTCIPRNASTNSITFTCTIDMWYFDVAASDWTINATIQDINAAYGENSTTTFTYTSLLAMTMSPPTLNWTEVGLTSTDVGSINDPITINNTGNAEPLNINVTAYNLRGEQITTQYIFANNFTVQNVTEGCTAGTAMSNATSTNVTSAILYRGNNSLNYNNATSGQEQIFFCLKGVPQDIGWQSYSSAAYGSWEIKILLVAVISAGRRRKKKLKKSNKILKLLIRLTEELRENYSKEKEMMINQLIKAIREEYKVSQAEILNLIRKEIEVPIEAFSKELGGLEAIVKYMKENLNMSYHLIAQYLSRDERTIWTAYKKATEKQKEPKKIKETDIVLPISIFENKYLTILESIIIYLKEKGFKFSEIAELLERDQRNIWTTYAKAKKKCSKEDNNI